MASDFDVTAVLYRPSDEAERKVPRPQVTFATITVPANVTSVQDLLTSLHFFVNSDALGLIYALNADLRDPRRLESGAKMQVAQIDSSPEIAKAFSEGFLWAIHYDDELVSSILIFACGL